MDKNQYLPISGTFLDEISHDIPHQNYGEQEWDRDFQSMKKMGIDTVILIRSGYRKFISFPSEVLISEAKAYSPPVDLVQLFLDKSEKHQMNFYFGTYDSGVYWDHGHYGNELNINIKLIEEVWCKYGAHPAFKGWYLSQEVSRSNNQIVEVMSGLGNACKKQSGNLPVLISPYIDGKKSVLASDKALQKTKSINPDQHYKEWDNILSQAADYIDIIAFQDGHVDFDELPDFLKANKLLADKYKLASWTNSESFDRDMPIKFLPIKFEKLLLKLKAAREAGIEKGITFEFSHFMSPDSCYAQAHHLYNRYMEFFSPETGNF